MRPGLWMDEGFPRLRHFRFVPMAGGYANDFDTLQAFVLVKSREDEARIFRMLQESLGSGVSIDVADRRIRLPLADGWNDLNPESFGRGGEIEEQPADSPGDPFSDRFGRMCVPIDAGRAPWRPGITVRVSACFGRSS